MSSYRSCFDYFRKASRYSLLAEYYKYQDPDLYNLYSHKHHWNIRKAIQAMHQDVADTRPTEEARLRFFHASPDVGEVDIYINGNRILRNFGYKDSSCHTQLQSGRYQIDIYPAGQSISALISKKVNVPHSKTLSAAISGTTPRQRLNIFEEDPFTPLGESKVRFIHLAADAPKLDLAVQGRDVIFPEVSFSQASSYLALTPMTVTLEARIAGTNDVVLTIPAITFPPNQSFSIAAVGTLKGERKLEALIVQG